MFCAKQARCQGRLFDCQFFHADAWVCLSQDRQRKYDWVEYENGIELGRQGQCISKYYYFHYDLFLNSFIHTNKQGNTVQARNFNFPI